MLLFTVFVYYTINDVIEQRRARTPEHEREPDLTQEYGIATALLLTALGLGSLVYGAELTVVGSVGLAKALGVSDAIIGITLVAVGTSLPEFAASLMASLKGHTDLAIGNVVGSNIFNLLLVMGLSSSVRTIEVPPGGAGDLAIAGLLAMLLLATSYTTGRRIVRAEAIVLGAVYLGYMVYRVLAYT